MAISKQVTVWCDADECDQWVGEEDSVNDARRLARHFGWISRTGRDLCPNHLTR